MQGQPPRCPFCSAQLELEKDVGSWQNGVLVRLTVIWCRRCGAILGGGLASG
jgi:hypothetical protein